ncbi:MAG: ABC transporter permease subunit [Proteobacteria bacterium]|nr:ABC transporter permease subunit [Pseudomonadota bacterium]
MSTDAATAPLERRSPWPLIWLGFLVAVVAIWLLRDPLIWLVKYPDKLEINLAKWIGIAAKWLVAHIQFLTRGLAAVLDMPLDTAIAVLAKGILAPNDAVIVPRVSWLGVIGAMTLTGYAYGGLRTAATVFLCFTYIAFFGQWNGAMLTLASVIVCVPIAVALGLGFGILAFRHPRLATWVVQPSLDLMQTMPSFAYLVPVLLLFGSGPVPALVATVIFASPPMVRATVLALRSVPEEVMDFGKMAGCSPQQKTWRIMIPSSRALLMVGVNQVIMMTLNMVIIASMIGAGGLGYDVLLALRQGDIGRGAVAGLAIVAIAISLDRISQAAAEHQARPFKSGDTFAHRHPYLIAGIGWLAVTTLISLFVPEFSDVPKSLTLTLGDSLNEIVKWININFFDLIEAIRTWLLLNVMNPVKQGLLMAPWIAILGGLVLAGYQLGGRRLALLVALLVAFILIAGQWEKAMISVYLCAISAVIAALIGIPIGAWASRSDWGNRVATIAVDTLQTLPTFVYLIPVVMLFRVGDVTAMIAIVSFAVTPAIRYTAHGLRNVSPQVVEAARAMGSTPRQILWRVQVPLALPEIMLGINQVILLSLSMLVITALVGTRDLGQEVYIALTKADPGRGIVAGLCVAFLGIVLDRLAAAGAKRARERLGLLDINAQH